MLSLFPGLFFLTPVAVALIRIAAGVAFGHFAWGHFKNVSTSIKVLGAIEAVCALLLIVGLHAQAAALLGIALSGLAIAVSKLRVFPLSTNILLLVICAALFVTGAGALAFDLPL